MLLDPKSPLPEDDAEHHSAFLAVWGVMLIQIELEIGWERDAEWHNTDKSRWVPTTLGELNEWNTSLGVERVVVRMKT